MKFVLAIYVQRLSVKHHMQTYRRAVIFVLILSLAYSSGPLHAQTLSRKELEEYRSFTERGCFIDQKSRRLNEGISDIVIERYCKCYAETVFRNGLTMQHVLQANRILDDRGKSAMVEYLLMGQNINDVAIHCSRLALDP